MARCLRTLPSKSAGVPLYLLAFKQPPVIPVAHEIRGVTDAEFLEDAEERVGKQLSIWADVLEEVKQRHAKYDKAMIE